MDLDTYSGRAFYHIRSFKRTNQLDCILLSLLANCSCILREWGKMTTYTVVRLNAASVSEFACFFR